MTKGYRKLLDNGGELFVNQLGKLYHVDVFAHDWERGQDPVYHATYGTMEDAMQDAESWKAWPES